MLGHELRNPLAAIQSATELIRMTITSNATLERAVGVLARQSDQMARLLDGLLEVSRIARGKIALDATTLDLRIVCDEIVRDRTSLFYARGLELRTEISAEPVFVVADRVRVAQVLDNLLGNALKFTPAPGRVVVTLEQVDDRAVLRVRDTGLGIDTNKLTDIFEAFHQEHVEVARASGGLGLGLALSKGLVELQHGTIEARSAGPGHGAEFVVRFPIVPPSKCTGDVVTRSRVESRRILVVEDNADAARMLSELLVLRGHRVDVAGSGPEALEKLRDACPDVVLCDIGLPGMSGYEVARAVRAETTTRRVLLVALTGYGQPEDRERTTEAGFDAHLTKPVTLEALESLLESRPP